RDGGRRARRRREPRSSTVTATSMQVQQGLTVEEVRLALVLVRRLVTGVRADGLFADDVFTDLSLPHWRRQAVGPDETFALRAASHPFPGDVAVRGLDRTSRGILIEFEERWEAGG